MRPVISIDVSHLRGRYEGRLLVAVGYDAENQLLPLAFGLVDKINISNWGCFMRWLRREVIGDGNNKKICVISDRHAAIKYIFENPDYDLHEETCNSVHRLCTQHIAENILKKFKNKYAAETFKKVARKNSP
jgi:MULE transposase domain